MYCSFSWKKKRFSFPCIFVRICTYSALNVSRVCKFVLTAFLLGRSKVLSLTFRARPWSTMSVNGGKFV